MVLKGINKVRSLASFLILNYNTMVNSDILYHAIRNKDTKVSQVFEPYINFSKNLIKTAIKNNRLHIVERNFKIHFNKHHPEWVINSNWKEVINKLT